MATEPHDDPHAMRPDVLFGAGRYLLPDHRLETLDHYLATEWGGLGLARAVELGPDTTTELVHDSGLRGRGGAGFPTGRKWSAVRSAAGSQRFVVANGAEGEPATFKDRALMRANPYQIVEGAIIAAFCVGASQAFIAVKSTFTEEHARLSAAVVELQQAGICRDCTITIVAGPEDYLFGEEKALLEVIEGKPAMPRLLPPYEHGLFATAPQLGWSATTGAGTTAESNPTLVNNVETLANLPPLLALGNEWYRSTGTASAPGNVVCTVVGDVRRDGVAEIAIGTPLREVVEAVGGGVAPGRTVKAVLSGVSNPVLRGDQLEVAMSYDDLARIGSGMGATGFAVYDDTACMVEVARQVSAFLAVESCGQCPPCKRGSTEITARLERIEAGVADARDLAEIARWLRQVTDGNRCYLAVQEQVVVASLLEVFADEVEEHLAIGRCPRPRPLPFPRLTDLVGGTASYASTEIGPRRSGARPV